MPRLFNAYVMVDWSSGQTPKTGRDSIWVGVSKRDSRFRQTFEAHNPSTRRSAEVLLREVMADLRRKGDRALVGFDFALGYPRGTASALKLPGTEDDLPWRRLWTFLAANVVDKADNTNNRFSLAARMNRLMTDEARPFWGAPARDAQRWLTSTKPPAAEGDLPALRLAEITTAARPKSAAKSVWQLLGAGSVGGQTLMGVPVVRRLVDELGGAARVWPFDTGWRAPTASELEGIDAVVVEIYPALIPTRAEPDEVVDRAQVRSCCEHFARLDEQNRLAPLFAPAKTVSPEDVQVVEREEGWILGL